MFFVAFFIIHLLRVVERRVNSVNDFTMVQRTEGPNYLKKLGRSTLKRGPCDGRSLTRHFGTKFTLRGPSACKHKFFQKGEEKIELAKTILQPCI